MVRGRLQPTSGEPDGPRKEQPQRPGLGRKLSECGGRGLSRAAGRGVRAGRLRERMERRAGGRGGHGSAAYDSHLESENDLQIGALAGKVSALKDISSQISIHIKNDNKLLDEMDTSFDNAGGLLGGTMKRLNSVATSAGSGNICYLAMFVIAVFLILWRLTKG